MYNVYIALGISMENIVGNFLRANRTVACIHCCIWLHSTFQLIILHIVFFFYSNLPPLRQRFSGIILGQSYRGWCHGDAIINWQLFQPIYNIQALQEWYCEHKLCWFLKTIESLFWSVCLPVFLSVIHLYYFPPSVLFNLNSISWLVVRFYASTYRC